MDVDFSLKLITQFTESILQSCKDKFVPVNNIYDLMAVGQEQYKEYTVISSQLEIELLYMLQATLPRIKQLREKLYKRREEVIEAIMDHPDC